MTRGGPMSSVRLLQRRWIGEPFCYTARDGLVVSRTMQCSEWAARCRISTVFGNRMASLSMTSRKVHGCRHVTPRLGRPVVHVDDGEGRIRRSVYLLKENKSLFTRLPIQFFASWRGIPYAFSVISKLKSPSMCPGSGIMLSITANICSLFKMLNLITKDWHN